MKIAIAGLATALTALVVLASASREAGLSERFSTGRVAASPSGNLRPAPDAVPRTIDGNAPSHGQDGTSLPRSERLSYEAPDAGAASPAPAVLSPPDKQLAALEQLVAQSRQESEQLGQINGQLAAQARQESEQLGEIDNHLVALRQQAADEEWRRQDLADQEAAQHAATLDALGILRQAEALLATGNSDGVDDLLVRAESALSGRTQLDVEAARQALARSDLYPARQYLAAALAERRVPR